VYSGALNNGGEAVELTDTHGSVLVYLEYNDAAPWPTSPDGFGFSLVIIDPAGDPNDPYNWRASTNSGGSPGTSVPPSGVPAVLINEALTHTDPPAVDTIEIYNPTGGNADIRGWYLTDDRREPKKAMIPNEPQYDIAAGGYAVITQDDFGDDPGPGMPGFYLNSHGDQVYVHSADGGGNLTGYSHGFRFGAAENGVSFGRHVSSDGREHFVAQSSNTLGSANAGPKIGPLVISEIYYHPVEDEIEYIELTNVSGGTVNLWDDSSGGDPTNTYTVRGIGFAFDPATTIGAGETLIIVDTDSPRTGEPPAYGPFGGGSVLDSAGETITLAWPDTPDFDYVPYVTMDEIEYDDESPWPDADGNGMALRRIDNNTFGNDPANWEAVAPSYHDLEEEDADNDGLSDAWESAHGLDPYDSDSDDDRLSDWYEVTNNGQNNQDDYEALVWDAETNPTGTNTDALNPDTDGDEIRDGVEVAFGYDPLDSSNTPTVPAANPMGLLILVVAMACAGLNPFMRRRTV